MPGVRKWLTATPVTEARKFKAREAKEKKTIIVKPQTRAQMARKASSARPPASGPVPEDVVSDDNDSENGHDTLPSVDPDTTAVNLDATPPASPTELPLPLKRKVKEEELETLDLRPSKVHQVYTKHETHWLPDGNVLLQLGKIRFKLSRGRLASESIWFQTLFDKRSGKVVDEPFLDQDEIDPILAAVDVIDGCDLFCLDIPHPFCPTAADFAELLTAMDNAISYTLDPPGFPVLEQIMRPSVFFRFGRYRDFAKHTISKIFVDQPCLVTATSLPDASHAITLGRNFLLLGILRPAFYELARLSPNSASPDGPTFALDTLELGRLLALQKQLTICWQGILNATSCTCTGSGSPCKKFHSGHTIAAGLQAKQALDPIQSLNEPILHDWAQVGFCSAATDHVRHALTREREKIWVKMFKWLDIEFN